MYSPHSHQVLAALFAASCSAQVVLNGGQLEGGQCESSDATYYYGIPYAQPPVGDLRFAPPQPYEGDYGGDATQPSVICPQFSGFIEDLPSSEDCLFLNIYVPPNAEDLPVKVWLYGGGNTAGSISNPTYNACNLATDAVVVTVGYRLGPLGFLAFSDAGIRGNQGIQDQLLALQWVQDNIEAFGGDASSVVLFGESAGARDTYAIGTLPQASSLMRAGIAQSGAGGTYPLAESANTQGAAWAQSLGCSDAACLRALDVSQLNVSVPETDVPSYNGYVYDSWDPIVDGEIIPAQPNDVGVQVPFIMGSNTMEGTLLILAAVDSPAAITPFVYTTSLQSQFGPAASLVAERYPLVAFNRTPFPAFSALVRIRTETSFLCPTYTGLQIAAERGTPAYAYLWGQAPTCPWYEDLTAASLPILGAAHTAEIPYVFANTRDSPLQFDCEFSASEQALSEEFVGFWTSMAAEGMPGGEWPGFRGAGDTAGITVEDGASSGTSGQIDYSVCEFWAGVREVVLQGSNGTVPGNGTGSGTTPSSPSQTPVQYEGGAGGLGAYSAVSGIVAAVMGFLWLLM